VVAPPSGTRFRGLVLAAAWRWGWVSMSGAASEVAPKMPMPWRWDDGTETIIYLPGKT
jgi:hypothetical protein